MDELTHTTLWRDVALSWYFSGQYWYVHAINRRTGNRLPEYDVGAGESKRDAFIDFIDSNK